MPLPQRHSAAENLNEAVKQLNSTRTINFKIWKDDNRRKGKRQGNWIFLNRIPRGACSVENKGDLRAHLCRGGSNRWMRGEAKIVVPREQAQLCEVTASLSNSDLLLFRTCCTGRMSVNSSQLLRVLLSKTPQNGQIFKMSACRGFLALAIS